MPDTLAYLQTIVANKAQYIGQPFSVLLNNLQIQIKYFSPFASIHHNKSKETSTLFSFYFPLSVADHYLSYPRLEIYWQPYLNAIQSNILFDNNNGGWVPTVVSYYTSGIIADIQILE